MKRVALGALVALATAEGCRCHHAGTVVATLVESKGSVEAARLGRWAPAADQQTFMVGDAIRTGAGAGARLKLVPDSMLRLGEDAYLRFVVGEKPDIAAIGLDLGTAEVEGDGQLVIATTLGYARLDPGTRLRVVANGKGTRYEVLVGRATLVQQNSEASFGVGEGFRIAVGSAQIERFKVEVGKASLEPLAAGAPVAAERTDAALPAPRPPAEPEPVAVAAGDDEALDAATPAGADTDDLPFDLVVAAGESSTIHDRAGRAVIKVEIGSLCPAGATLQVQNGARRSRVHGRRALVAALGPGSNRYRLVCDGRDRAVKATGSLFVRPDSGTAPVPNTPPVNMIDADGRNYTLLYQNRLPSVTFQWTNAPVSAGYTVHLTSEGKSRDIASKKTLVSIPSGTLGEGAHELWFTSADGKSSAHTRVVIRFDNAATTAQLKSPAAGAPWAGQDVAISGIALEGSTVTVNGQPMNVDSQGRFTGTLAVPPRARALVVRLEHPRGGLHHYLRRPAGSK